MASDSHASTSGSGMDYAEHERTYGMFLGLVKWGTIGLVVLLIGMAIVTFKLSVPVPFLYFKF